MHRFEVLGIVDEPGHCELCGTYCPARRVAVRLADSDDVSYWGVVCAAEARSGRRDSTLARQLRQEAEEAGEYDAARPHAGRRAGTVRRQTRRAAIAAAAAAAAEDRIVWARTSSSVPAGLTPEAAAEYRYRQAGRRPECSYMTADAAGRLAAVDRTDPADVARFARAGFTHAAWLDLPSPEPAAA
jgi:hypothetical protein